MAEKLKWTASINSKGLDTTGVTQDHAQHMAATPSGHTMMVIEVRHGPRLIDEDGNTKVNLIITSAEPVPEELEDRVREFQRALWRQRPEVLGQETLKGTGGDGPSVDQSVAALDPEVWSGDPDEPITAPTVLASVPSVPEGPFCPFPGCGQEDQHEGDHDEPGEDDDTEASDG